MAENTPPMSSPPHGGDAPVLIGWVVSEFCWQNTFGENLIDWHLYIQMPDGTKRTAIFSQPCPLEHTAGGHGD